MVFHLRNITDIHLRRYYIYVNVFSEHTYEILFELIACMHWKSVGSFKDRSYLIGYVPELN